MTLKSKLISFLLGVVVTLTPAAFSQTARTVMVQSNTGVVIFPTNLWGANASAARTGMSLATHATNPVVPVSSGGSGATNASSARTNFGLPWSGLTNPSATTMRASLGFSTNLDTFWAATNQSAARLSLGFSTNLNTLWTAVNATNARSALGLVGSALGSTIGGGDLHNSASAYSTVGGGYSNSATEFFTTVAGGGNNIASGYGAAVGGGQYNIASGYSSVVSGGQSNVAGSGWFSTVAGGLDNLASGFYSYASGTRAKATNEGAFVWADSQTADFASTNSNSFNVRASGGMSLDLGTNGITFRNALNAGVTRTNLGIPWSGLTNSSSATFRAALFGSNTNPVLVNTNGLVVSPTNFWQVAPIQTLVQDFTGIAVSQTNNATNARDVYIYSLATNISGISNTILLPVNTSTFNGDEVTVVHRGTTNTTTVVRQDGSVNNLITLNTIDESAKFIRESGQWVFYRNISHVAPITFSSTNAAANAAASRTNLGLGTTNLVTFRGLVTDNVEIIGGGTLAADEPAFFNGEWTFSQAPQFTFAAATRANLGFSTNLNTLWTATNSSNARSAIGLGATNDVAFARVVAGSDVTTNDIRYAIDTDGIEIEHYGNSSLISFVGGTNLQARFRSDIGVGSSNSITFAGLTNNGDITINQTTATNGLLFIRRTNNEAFLGMANFIASNNTAVNNETLFRVGVAEATNKSAQFGFRSTNANGNGVAVFSVFGYNALMMIGPSDPAAGTNPIEATVYSVSPTNKVMTLIKTNTGATMFHRAIEFENTTNQAVTRTNLGIPLAALTNTTAAALQGALFSATNAAPTTTTNVAGWVDLRVGTNTYKLPVYQ